MHVTVNSRRASNLAARYAVLGLTLMGVVVAVSQEPDANAPNSDASAAQVLSQLDDLVHGVDSPQAAEMVPPGAMALTNGLPEAAGSASVGNGTNRPSRLDNSGKSRGDDRQSRGRRSSRPRSGQSGSSRPANDNDRAQGNGSAGTNNGTFTLDYASFKIIVERNIFDPNRHPHKQGAPPVVVKTKSVASVTLVGTMSYEKGAFAFFDGTSSEYRKALKLTDSIVGYKVTNIAPNSVRLATKTNELELQVGAQLRREEDGPWLLAGQSTSIGGSRPSMSTTGAAVTTPNGTNSATGGAESDIIKKLMQRREKE